MNSIFFSLASNTDQIENIGKAVNKIKLLPVCGLTFSPVKMYEPVNFSYQSDRFANCIGSFNSPLSMERLVLEMHKIESYMGRTYEYRKENPDKIIIDIDIVVFNDNVIRVRDYEQEYFKEGFNHIKSII